MILQIAHSTLTNFGECTGTDLKKRLDELEEKGYYTKLFALASRSGGGTMSARKEEYSISLVHQESIIDYQVSYLYAFFLRKDVMHPSPSTIKDGEVLAYMYPNNLGKYSVEMAVTGDLNNIVFSSFAESKHNHFYIPQVTEEAENTEDGNFSIREVSPRAWEPFLFKEGKIGLLTDSGLLLEDGNATISRNYLLDRVKLIPYM